MCGNATLAIVLSTPCMIVANMIEIVIAPRLKPAPRSSPRTGAARSSNRVEQPAADARAGAVAQPGGDQRVEAEALAVLADRENQLQQQQEEIGPRPLAGCAVKAEPQV